MRLLKKLTLNLGVIEDPDDDILVYSNEYGDHIRFDLKDHPELRKKLDDVFLYTESDDNLNENDKFLVKESKKRKIKQLESKKKDVEDEYNLINPKKVKK